MSAPYIPCLVMNFYILRKITWRLESFWEVHEKHTQVWCLRANSGWHVFNQVMGYTLRDNMYEVLHILFFWCLWAQWCVRGLFCWTAVLVWHSNHMWKWNLIFNIHRCIYVFHISFFRIYAYVVITKQFIKHNIQHRGPPGPGSGASSGTGALPGQGNHLLNRRTRGGGGGPSDEEGEFDFEAGLAKFDKEKVRGVTGWYQVDYHSSFYQQHHSLLFSRWYGRHWSCVF